MSRFPFGLLRPGWSTRITSGVRSAKIKLSLEVPTRGRPRAWANPVIPGDHPDPTILRVGETFWASCTSGEWSPQFPLFRSADLVNWVLAGSVFPVQPAWAEGAFWAPELVHDEVSGRFVVWYVGKQRGGPLCIAVATAEAAEGPYRDHGPLIGQPDGSIDPCFARDEVGAPYLIWKEDGNSQGRPTPIWAQRLSDDLLGLTGEKTMLIVNDQPWEEGVVEGPYILRRHGWFYMFYAGNSCCGKECKYAEGVARSRRLLGPWEKAPGNPMIGANDRWRCPGHGTAVHTRGTRERPAQDYLLYHAYPADGTVYVGREAILDEITWPPFSPDGTPGWPVVNAGRGPGENSPASPIHFADDFEGPLLEPSWQWPVNTLPEVGLEAGSEAGRLRLGIPRDLSMAANAVESALLAVANPAAEHYVAGVTLGVPRDSVAALWAGLVVVGDPFNTIGLGLRGIGEGAGRLQLWQRRGATQEVLWETVLESVRTVRLRVGSTHTVHHLQFAFCLDDSSWQNAGEVYNAVDLPAWDRALRIGLMLEGPRGMAALFERFRLDAGPKDERAGYGEDASLR